LLADRVVLFAGRPGHIRADVKIDLPRPRDVKSKRFLQVENEIEALVHEDKVKEFEPEALVRREPTSGEPPREEMGTVRIGAGASR